MIEHNLLTWQNRLVNWQLGFFHDEYKIGEFAVGQQMAHVASQLS